MKSRLFPSVLLAALAFLAPGCSSYTPSSEPVSSLVVPASASKEKVRAAIKSAAAERGWNFVAETETQLDLTYKGFTARVTFDDKAIRIYQTGGSRDVSGWLRNLATRIDAGLARN